MAQVAAHCARIAEVGGAAVPACGADLVSFLAGDGLPEPPGIGLPVGSDRDLHDIDEPDRATAYGELIRQLLLAGQPEPLVRGVLEDNALAFLRRVLP